MQFLAKKISCEHVMQVLTALSRVCLMLDLVAIDG